MTTTRWWWVRHAPVINSGGRIYGQGDLDCDCGDEAVFRALAVALPREAVWVTSTLKRTQQTARAILAARGDDSRELIQVPGLIEQHFGEWQGRLRSEVEARRPEDWTRFWIAPADQVPPGGESFAQLVDRVADSIKRLSREHAGQDIVAVTHGGTIRAALALALNMAPEQALAFSIDNCSLTRLDHIADAPSPVGVSHGREEGPLAGVWRVALVNHKAWTQLALQD